MDVEIVYAAILLVYMAKCPANKRRAAQPPRALPLSGLTLSAKWYGANRRNNVYGERPRIPGPRGPAEQKLLSLYTQS